MLIMNKATEVAQKIKNKVEIKEKGEFLFNNQLLYRFIVDMYTFYYLKYNFIYVMYIY